MGRAVSATTSGELLTGCVRDFRYAARSLRESPGLTAAAILTLGLGIGSNAAILGVLDCVFLAPVPYANPDRLVVVALYNQTLKYATRWPCFATSREVRYSPFLRLMI